MKVLDLEQVIRDYIYDIYHKCYAGKIQILKLDPIGYHIQLELGVSNKPLIIYAELEDYLFLKFLKEEIKTKKFDLVYYGKLNMTYPYNCEPHNTSCSCNDKG